MPSYFSKLCVLLFACCIPFWGSARTSAWAGEAVKPPPQAGDAQQASSGVAAIADSEIIPRGEQTIKSLQKIKAEVAADSTLRSMQSEFTDLVKKSDERRARDAETMAKLRSMQRINEITREWNLEQTLLEGWDRALTRKSQILTAEEKDIDRIVETWRVTQAAVAKKFFFKAVLERRVEEVLREAQTTRKIVQEETTRLLKLQSEIADRMATVTGIQNEIDQAREELGRSLFKLDSPPLWEALFGHEVTGASEARPSDSARRLLDDAQRFAEKNAERIPVHLLVFLLILGLFHFLRRSLTPDAAATGPLATTVILNRAVAASFLLALFASLLLYPGTATVILRSASMVSAIPICRLLPALLPKRYRPWVYLAVLLFVLEFFRYLLPQDGLFSRLLLLMIATGGLFGLGWFVLSQKKRRESAGLGERLVSWAMWLVGFLFALSVLGNVIGNLSLAEVLVVIPIRIVYAAGLIFTVAQLLNTLVALILRSPAAHGLRSVREHNVLLAYRFRILVGFAAIILWLLVSLNIGGVLGDVVDAAEGLLQWRWTVGAAEISIQGLAAFLVVFLTAVLVSRMSRFVLTEEILPRLRLPRGVPGAVDVLCRYGIMLLGFLIALAAAGVDFSRVTLLVSALGVGIGFGLQNVVNNFVSGLILVFEHPVQVGDFVEVGTTFGQISKIGFRASILRTPDGSDLIIPNSELTGSRVVNWSLSDRLRRISVSVNVAYGTDPNRVISILLAIAQKQAGILTVPAPQAVFDRFGDSALNFTLFCWATIDNFAPVRSELTVAVHNAFKENGIEIPFPQQDVHVHLPDGVGYSSQLSEPAKPITTIESPLLFAARSPPAKK
jgi:potassium-dependent mechanosensitive channel